MKLTAPLRHVEFGRLGVYVRGLVTYSLSPYHLKAFHDPLARLERTVYRCAEASLQVVPLTVLAWLIHNHVEKKYIEINRKDPKIYANDK